MYASLLHRQRAAYNSTDRKDVVIRQILEAIAKENRKDITGYGRRPTAATAAQL